MKKSEAIKTRTIPFVFSDESRDAYNTVLPVDGWLLDRFNRLGVAFYNHSSYGSDPDNVIGRARAWIDGKKLVGEITFETADVNPKAEKVFQKLLAGTIRGCSVGFRPVERGHWGEGDEACGGKRETYYYGRRELLEISVTPLPANANARVRRAGTDEDKEEVEKELILEGEVRAFDAEPEPGRDKKTRETPGEIQNETAAVLAEAEIALAATE